jgi:hypothetical protein
VAAETHPTAVGEHGLRPIRFFALLTFDAPKHYCYPNPHSQYRAFASTKSHSAQIALK